MDDSNIAEETETENESISFFLPLILSQTGILTLTPFPIDNFHGLCLPAACLPVGRVERWPL